MFLYNYGRSINAIIKEHFIRLIDIFCIFYNSNSQLVTGKADKHLSKVKLHSPFPLLGSSRTPLLSFHYHGD